MREKRWLGAEKDLEALTLSIQPPTPPHWEPPGQSLLPPPSGRDQTTAAGEGGCPTKPKPQVVSRTGSCGEIKGEARKLIPLPGGPDVNRQTRRESRTREPVGQKCHSNNMPFLT